MTDRFADLEARLLSIRDDLSKRGLRSDASWEREALATALDNVETYARTLSDAMKRRDFATQKKMACAASSMDKGISELSLLDHGLDNALINEISEMSALSLDLCFSLPG